MGLTPLLSRLGRLGRFILALWAALCAGACGYTLQNSSNPLKDKEGVSRIYVAPITNGSFKPGIENVVYNALLKSLASRNALVIVHDPEVADAILQGTVVVAQQTISGTTTSNNISPANLSGATTSPLNRSVNNPNATVTSQINGTDVITVANQYSAELQCAFTLQRTHLKFAKQPKQIWGASFDRTEPYPASNQLDIYGTTSALINDSELDRTLQDLANSMMIDVQEAMLSVF